MGWISVHHQPDFSLLCVYTHTHIYVYRIEMPQYILSQMTAAAYTHL